MAKTTVRKIKLWQILTCFRNRRRFAGLTLEYCVAGWSQRGITLPVAGWPCLLPDMITAEEWIRLDARIPIGLQSANADDLIAWVDKIQFNAWREGMYNSTEICRNSQSLDAAIKGIEVKIETEQLKRK